MVRATLTNWRLCETQPRMVIAGVQPAGMVLYPRRPVGGCLMYFAADYVKDAIRNGRTLDWYSGGNADFSVPRPHIGYQHGP